ncbi:MAG TPA: hypothetical protein EYP71_01115 [Dehalococcoidia bacterium]|nr:hypothetical protein [Dehalococcoidia bacterium]
MAMSQGREVSITVRVTTIRDGTHGISIVMPDRLVGEWTDSGAGSLMLTDEYNIRVFSKDGTHRYLLTMPGKPIRGEQLSDTEALVVICV